MSFTLRPAVREAVGLIIGLAGGTGSGKTYSAMRLAAGIAGDRKFAVIDTEAGRAKYYADTFKFDHGDLTPPFRPEAYSEAIAAVDKEGYPVIVVDSMSHEWAGTGGVLDWQEEEYKRLGAKESIKLLSWSAPKQAHKRMVAKLLQVRAHLILCFRAEPHIEMVKEEGKTVVRPKSGFTGYEGWFPVTEKNLPFELTAYFMLMAQKPGVPLPITLREPHRAIFPKDQPITEESGRRLAQWASGGSAATGEGQAPSSTVSTPSGPGNGVSGAYISVDQVTYLADQCKEHGLSVESLKKAAHVGGLPMILAADYPRALKWIETAIERRTTA